MLKVRVGAPVVAHLFTVASGLDSMVVGEAEIGGQIARAFREAQAAGTASPAINLLFQSAARTAKQVGHRHRARRGRPVGGLGRAGHRRRSARLAGVPGALVIGTGAYARVVAAELRARGCADLLGASRPAAGPTRSPSGTPPRRWTPTRWSTRWRRVDLVVACSGRSAGVLDEPMLAAAVARRTPVADHRSRAAPGRRRGRPGGPRGPGDRPAHRRRSRPTRLTCRRGRRPRRTS